MIKYEEARKFAINALERAIEKHKSGNWASIGDELDEFEVIAPEEEIEKDTLLFYVLEFWASWASCAEHTWDFEPEIKEHQWPELAVVLIDNLSTNTKVTNSKIVSICK